MEDVVLGALRTRLMASEVYAAFVRDFTAEWNAVQKGRAVLQEGQHDELKRLTRKIGDFLDEIGEGHRSPELSAALKEAEARQASLEAGLAVAEAPAPRILPNLPEVYRGHVAMLQEALAGEDATVAREKICGLIDAVRLVPCPAAWLMTAALAFVCPERVRPRSFRFGAVWVFWCVVAGARNHLDLLTRG